MGLNVNFVIYDIAITIRTPDFYIPLITAVIQLPNSRSSQTPALEIPATWIHIPDQEL